MLKSAFLNLKAIYYNNIINFLLLIDIFIPNYFKNNIINFQNKSIKCINYTLFLDISTTINKKYNIDLTELSKNLYNKYITYVNTNDNAVIENDDNISFIDNDDLSELESDLEDYDSDLEDYDSDI